MKILDESNREARVSVAIVAVLIGCAIVTRLLPYDARPFNMTAIGGLAIFAAARFRIGTALGIVFATILASDLVLFARHGYDRAYLPNYATYFSLLVYPAVALLLLRRSAHPLRVAASAFAGATGFFIVSNFIVWVGSTHMYPKTLAGLAECFTMAIPFYHGFLIGDLVFASAAFLVFGLLTAESRMLAAALIRTGPPRQ